jgi:hypothetical protein
MSSPFLTISEQDGKFWVDTGHDDVGPFDTRAEAEAHIWRIIDDRKNHELSQKRQTEVKKFLEDINGDFYVEFFNKIAPEKLFSLEQRTHHHVFSEIEDYPEEGVHGFICSCGVNTFYVDEDE